LILLDVPRKRWFVRQLVALMWGAKGSAAAVLSLDHPQASRAPRHGGNAPTPIRYIPSLLGSHF